MTRRTIFTAAALIIAGTLSIFAVARPAPTDAQPAARATSALTPSPSPAAVTPDAAPRRVPNKAVAATNPDPKHPTGDLIEVSIESQTLTAWRNGTVAMRFPISTGQKGYETPTGRYKVYYKTRMGWSSSWKVWMPWAMAWNGNYMIHQLPHYPGAEDRPIGRSTLGSPASHGCIRVDTGDAERLYRWTKLGTPVWVH